MSEGPGLRQRPEDVDPAWLTAVLRASGALAAGATVDGCTHRPIGTGQMADSYRFELACTGDDDAPGTVVLKLAAASDMSRMTGLGLGTYEAEVGFYRELAGQLSISVPRCHLAVVDPETGWFTLVLSDLAPAEQGDQIKGCSPDVAAVALEHAVRLHAPRWGDPSLADIPWYSRSVPDSMASTGAMLGVLFTGFAERYDGRLDAASIEACRRFVEGAATWNVPPESPRTLQHGDYRLDNMLFGDGVAAPELSVVDWQTIVRGHAMADVAYFMGNALEPADREACEVDLVRGYHEQMRAAGVEGWSWDDCWRDYRYFSFFGLMMGIGASMLVEQTERGDEMFMTNVRRAAAHVDAMDAFALVETAP